MCSAPWQLFHQNFKEINLWHPIHNQPFCKVSDLGKYRLTSGIYVLLRHRNVENRASSTNLVRRKIDCDVKMVSSNLHDRLAKQQICYEARNFYKMSDTLQHEFLLPIYIYAQWEIKYWTWSINAIYIY